MDATPEQWRPVVGWESLYEVSDMGRIRSIDRWILVAESNRSHGHSRRHSGRLLNPFPSSNKNPYPRVNLCNNGIHQFMAVHTPVLTAFHGPCPAGMEACHNNGNPSDCQLSNLRWDTRSENHRDATMHGRNSGANKTHCLRGHLYTEENTIIKIYAQADGKTGHGRECRECKRIKSRRPWRKSRAREHDKGGP